MEEFTKCHVLPLEFAKCISSLFNVPLKAWHHFFSGLIALHLSRRWKSNPRYQSGFKDVNYNEKGSFLFRKVIFEVTCTQTTERPHKAFRRDDLSSKRWSQQRTESDSSRWEQLGRLFSGAHFGGLTVSQTSQVRQTSQRKMIKLVSFSRLILFQYEIWFVYS